MSLLDVFFVISFPEYSTSIHNKHYAKDIDGNIREFKTMDEAIDQIKKVGGYGQIEEHIKW